MCCCTLLILFFLMQISRASNQCDISKWRIVFHSVKGDEFSCNIQDYGYVDLIPPTKWQRISRVDYQLCSGWNNRSDVKLFHMKTQNGVRGEENIKVVHECTETGSSVNNRMKMFDCSGNRKEFDFVRIGFPNGRTGKIQNISSTDEQCKMPTTTTTKVTTLAPTTTTEPSTTAELISSTETVPASTQSSNDTHSVTWIIVGIIAFIVVAIVLVLIARRRHRPVNDGLPTNQVTSDRPGEVIYGNIINLPVRSEPIYADLQFSGNAARPADTSAKRRDPGHPDDQLYGNVNRAVNHNKPEEESVIYACVQTK